MDVKTPEAVLIENVLNRLRSDADAVGTGWKPRQWRIVDTATGTERNWDAISRPNTLSWIVDALGELDLIPHEQLTMRTKLDIPDELFGEPVTGQPLEMTVRSLYPTQISVDGRVVLEESVPPVATGPALIEVSECVTPDWTGDLELVVSPLDGQRGGGVTWLELVFRTPALRHRYEVIDLAWARLALAARLTRSSREVARVIEAAQLIPENIPSVATNALEAVFDKVVAMTDNIGNRAAEIQVHIIGHSHIDLAWLWTWEDTKEVIKRDVRSVLSIMNDYPEATFTHSQPAGYEVLRTEEPELFTQVVERIAEGRWEPATTQWVECDSNMPSGEALAAQVREGIRFSDEYLGGPPRVLLAPDTFGHSANLPQIAKSAGADFYYHMRCNPGAHRGDRWPAYWWEGIDGTRILALSTEGYNGSLTAGAIARTAIEAMDAGLDHGLLFVGVGDHGGAPTRQGYDTFRRVGDTVGMPRSACSTVAAYGDAILQSGVALPVHVGESPRIFEGCYTTHADVKRLNRDGENLIVTTETLAAMAGVESPPALDQAWRTLCLHQFHDIICGSAIPEVYDMTANDHQTLVTTCSEIIRRCTDALVGELASGEIAVTNPHAHRCKEPVVVTGTGHIPGAVRDAAGRISPTQTLDDGSWLVVAEVDGFSTAKYVGVDHVPTPGNAVRVQPIAGKDGDDRYIEILTPHFRAIIRRDCGIIVSLVDLREDRELVAWGLRRSSDYGDSARPDLGLNVFQLARERPHFLAAWQIQEVYEERSLVDGATTEVVENGPVRTVLRVTHEFGESRVVEDLIFYADIDRIDLVVSVDWHEQGSYEDGIPNLKLSFAPDLARASAWYETPFGAVERPANGQNNPALRWTDVGTEEYGFAILNDSVYGHEMLGSRARLNLLRTSYMPDPRSDEGLSVFRISLIPHGGDWRKARIPMRAAAFNQPLVVTTPRTLAPPAEDVVGLRPRIEAGRGLVSATMRPAASGCGAVLRLVESAGQRTRVTISELPEASLTRDSDLVERPGRVVGSGSSIDVELGAFEVKTLLVGET